MKSTMKLLEMVNICKTYPGVKALNDVKFNLMTGEVHGLVGENGAGKSTLIKSLMGIVQMDRGKIYIEGKETVIKDSHMARKIGISAIFQDLSQIPTLTVAENIFLGQELTTSTRILDRSKMIEQTEEILGKYGIDLNPRALISDLSIAKRQLAEIVKAILINPKILIMDEPTASLPECEAEILFSIIKDFKNKGTGIIYVSHRMNELFRIADKVTVLRDGCYIDTCKVEDLDMKSVVKLMVGREIDLYSKNQYCRNQKTNFQPVLEVKNICKQGSFNNISFSLRKGEILGFAGLVGSGRSELANIIFGIDNADSGEILIDGVPTKILSVKDALSHGIAMVPENRHIQGLVLMHSIEKNIILPIVKKFSFFQLMNYKKSRKFVNEKIHKLSIKTEGLNKIVNQLSGGNQQKVVVAKWISTMPKILIVDELTAGIDVGSKSEIHRIVRSLADSGVSVIMISSEMTELLAHSDRVAVMNNYRILGILDCADQEQIMNMIMNDNLNRNRQLAGSGIK